MKQTMSFKRYIVPISEILEIGVQLTEVNPENKKWQHCLNNYTCHYFIIFGSFMVQISKFHFYSDIWYGKRGDIDIRKWRFTNMDQQARSNPQEGKHWQFVARFSKAKLSTKKYMDEVMILKVFLSSISIGFF